MSKESGPCVFVIFWPWDNWITICRSACIFFFFFFFLGGQCVIRQWKKKLLMLSKHRPPNMGLEQVKCCLYSKNSVWIFLLIPLQAVAVYTCTDIASTVSQWITLKRRILFFKLNKSWKYGIFWGCFQPSLSIKSLNSASFFKCASNSVSSLVAV